MEDTKKADEKLKRLMNTNFTDKDFRLEISYEKSGSKEENNDKRGGNHMAAEKTKCAAVENSQAEDVREFIELLKGMDEKNRQRTLGYMDALKSLGGQLVAQTA